VSLHAVACTVLKPSTLSKVTDSRAVVLDSCWFCICRPTFQQIVARLEQLMQLSPEKLHSGGALWSHAFQQQQHQQQLGLAVQTAAYPDAAAAAAEAEAAVAAVDLLQQQQQLQQEQQQQQQQPGDAGSAGLELTGAWSLPGVAVVQKTPRGW
jgi:hypothetical protein